MNLDLDFSAIPRFFRGIATELRQKPVLAGAGVVLLLALVAVPVLLSKSSNPAPTPEAQLPASPPQGGASIPALNVQTTPSQSHLTGSARNPFGSSGSATATAHTSSASTVTAVSTATSNTASTLSSGGASSTSSSSAGGSSSTGSGSQGAASAGTPTSSTPNPPSITGNAKPKPVPSGLKSSQAYDVSMAITTSSGGINTVDPLGRLSLVPSDQQPMLIELGVEQGGNRVLFAVQPNTVPVGPGSCTPGPIDCEILSLGQDQTEELATRTGSVGTSEVALFAITGVTASNYPSSGAADKARRAESANGRALLDQSASSHPALSLFQYEPSLGSIVDLRNLKVGDS